MVKLNCKLVYRKKLGMFFVFVFYLSIYYGVGKVVVISSNICC